MDSAEIVRRYYDDNVAKEWDRLTRHKVEYELTTRFMRRYIRPGDRVLDIGGGPGRYALCLAELGCDVTLFDLSPNNVDFALCRAKDEGHCIQGICGDAREVRGHVQGTYDHVLLMGPMYHLTGESDRVKAVNECLACLKPGGTLFVSFISSYAGIIYSMKYQPENIVNEQLADEYETFAQDKAFSGHTFTHAHMIRCSDILPFMSQFPLEKLHLLGCESILAPCEPTILAQPPEVVDAWLNLAERVCEREDLLSFAEHFLYVGRKK